MKEGSEFLCKINWKRRFDHMQQHSGTFQTIVSQTKPVFKKALRYMEDMSSSMTVIISATAKGNKVCVNQKIWVNLSILNDRAPKLIRNECSDFVFSQIRASFMSF